ncbi:DUF1684 domain-containing protein [Coralloluteibacterium stylophorae]|uniref:DUF1684 domain-containing protein n=1 Tax=Coralloluteibacterium stylophorae TaxID=1776034 RepID=A0A8J7VV94_9GAMM|nr:DUF1684 domain-containing protein [Coralloluteibacterium stylophorae]
MVGVLAALAGCRGDEAGAPTSSQGDSRERQAHRLDVEQWRAERLGALHRPDGWLALVGLHWIEPGGHYAGSSGSNGIRLAAGPAHLGLFDLRDDGRVWFTPDRSRPDVQLDGKPVRGRVVLRTDRDGAPDVLRIDGGLVSAMLIERGGRIALRVRDARAAQANALAAIPHFEVDPAWRIVARFEAHAPGTTLEIVNVLGATEAMANPGRVLFGKDGREYALEALDEGDGRLLLIVADRTSGHDSYGAGRYLGAPRPDRAGRTVLDFNKLENPPCAFTDYATCPLPPAANRLDLAITAGEKRLPRSH